MEFDGTYSGVKNFTFRISSAYNDTHYVEFKNVPKPQELGYLSGSYLDRSGVLQFYVITDFSIGITGKANEYDASIVVKNIFDEAP